MTAFVYPETLVGYPSNDQTNQQQSTEQKIPSNMPRKNMKTERTDV